MGIDTFLLSEEESHLKGPSFGQEFCLIKCGHAR